MADLNKELSEYLLSNKNEKQYKLPSLSMSKPNFKKWLGKDTEEEEVGWLREKQRECCPSMVSIYYFTIINFFYVQIYTNSFLFFQTRMQRLTAFGVCFLMGILCFSLSAIYVPVLILKARKFALLYSMGSLFFLMRYVEKVCFFFF